MVIACAYRVAKLDVGIYRNFSVAEDVAVVDRVLKLEVLGTPRKLGEFSCFREALDCIGRSFSEQRQSVSLGEVKRISSDEAARHAVLGRFVDKVFEKIGERDGGDEAT